MREGIVVLVTGGRDYWNCGVVLALDSLHAQTPIALLIHGGAPGADHYAGRWALDRGVHCAQVHALWHLDKKSAGSKRNTAMALLAKSIDLCVAFPGGVGTADMVDKAQDAGIRVWAPYED